MEEQVDPGNPVGGQAQLEELGALYRLTDRVYRATSLDQVYEAALDAITATLDCNRASILLFDEEGVMRFVAWRGLSERYRSRLEGHSPWVAGQPDPDPIFVPDIALSDESDRVKDEITREGIRALGFIPLLIGGQVIGKFMVYYPEPRQLSAHALHLAETIARQVGFSIERARIEAARREAMRDLRLSERRFRMMSENAPVMIWMSGPSGACLHLNRKLREFWGVTDGAAANFDWLAAVHPEDAPAIAAEIGAAMQARREAHMLGRYRSAGGEWRWLQTDAQPRLGADGRFLGMIGVNVDVTERERTAKQRELMLAELNHRVKNTLAVVQAIAYQSFRDEADRASVAAFAQRLVALASAHNLLTKQNWESTPLDQLIGSALASSRMERSRVKMAGPMLTVSPKVALSIAMALHELQTNAIKHGAFSVDSGHVSLTWEGDAAAGRLRVNWVESGGPKVSYPSRRGFGTVMIEDILAKDVGGSVKLDFRDTGVQCVIEVPIESGIAMA